MFKFLATAVLALSAFSSQAAICHYCASNGPSEHGVSLQAPVKQGGGGIYDAGNGAAEHGLSVEAPGKVCPTRSCNGNEDPNGAADHGTILILDVPGKNCPARGCTGVDEPNGRSEHGLAS